MNDNIGTNVAILISSNKKDNSITKRIIADLNIYLLPNILYSFKIMSYFINNLSKNLIKICLF